jgi:hypothetical protein
MKAKVITIISDISTDEGEQREIEYPTIDKYLEDGWIIAGTQYNAYDQSATLALTFILHPPH